MRDWSNRCFRNVHGIFSVRVAGAFGIQRRVTFRTYTSNESVCICTRRRRKISFLLNSIRIRDTRGYDDVTLRRKICFSSRSESRREGAFGDTIRGITTKNKQAEGEYDFAGMIGTTDRMFLSQREELVRVQSLRSFLAERSPSWKLRWNKTLYSAIKYRCISRRRFDREHMIGEASISRIYGGFALSSVKHILRDSCTNESRCWREQQPGLEV